MITQQTQVPGDDWDTLLATADAAIDALREQVDHMVSSGLWPAPERMANEEATSETMKAAA